MTSGHRGLKVYQMAFRLAMEIFEESKKFPKDERYSLTDRSVAPRAVWRQISPRVIESGGIRLCS